METKWKEKWNYYGWKEYLDIMPETSTMQRDWNSTFTTKTNMIVAKIKGIDKDAEIGISVHSSLFELLIKKLPFLMVLDGITYVSKRYPVNIDDTLAEDKVYVYQNGVDENIGEVLIDFVTETRD
jgi:hypothetical protein